MKVVSNVKEFVDTFNISDWQLRKFKHSIYPNSDDYRHGLNGYTIIDELDDDYVIIATYLNWKHPNKYIVFKQDGDIYIYEKIELITIICESTYF